MIKKDDIVKTISIQNTDSNGNYDNIKKHHESGGLLKVISVDSNDAYCELIGTNDKERWFYNLNDIILVTPAVYPTPMPLCPVIGMKSKSPEAGVKHDSGKPRMELLPPEGLEEVAKVFAFGANKYGDYNWRGGIKTSRLAGAMLRHVFAYLRGETNDPESGLPHMAHAMCNGLMILTMNKARPDLDDRYKDVK